MSSSSSHGSRARIIRMTTGPHSQTWVWDGHSPLQLLNRARSLNGWILEAPASGPRIRHLASNQIHEISSGAQFQVGALPVSFTLSDTHPVAAPLAPNDPSRRGSSIELQHRFKDWIYKSETCREGTRLFEDGKVLASLQVRGSQVEVQPEGNIRAEHLEVRLELTQVRTFDLALAPLLLKTATHTWSLQLGAEGAALAPSSARAHEQDDFKKTLLFALGGVAALLMVIPLLPKATVNKDEVVPEQFAKIVLTPQPPRNDPAKAAAASSGAPGAATATATQKKTEVVQALRSKALQNSMSSLVKGGMSQLLAQSDFIAGKNTQAKSQALFQSKNAALEYTTTGVSGATQNSVVVGALGGGSGSGSGGKGQAGYGQGVRAGFSGQGKSLVSLETEGAAVEDGLTKDEVGAVIHKHMSEVRYCYESAMIRTADLEGKLQIKFVINAQGVVSQADVQQSTLSDPRLDDCVVRRLVTWKFPQPKGGVNVTVSYPFLFKTLGR